LGEFVENINEYTERISSRELLKKVISVSELSKSFGSYKAVKNVNLDVFKGEVLGLLGPNGAGKTTLISMLS
jgi:ABC-type multidrug transport system ATPase subunit